MALRTFHCNPSLGGFGGETADLLLPCRSGGKLPLVKRVDGDAFAQIIKELVDNAVDACTHDGDECNTEPASCTKRVRVVIEPYTVRLPEMMGNLVECTQESKSGDCDNVDIESWCEILRVTVSDNGSGMEDIQACVEAFRTSKAHESTTKESQTSGRYGIGLTLCLLHAQRLVPNSCASIQSATKENEYWNSTLYVVDTEGDSVKCIQSESRKKAHPDESGTSVSILVPGGPGVCNSWPRLAEYFARFKLSHGLRCGIEVFAPTLSRVPLHVSPTGNTEQSESEQSPDEEDENTWADPLVDIDTNHLKRFQQQNSAKHHGMVKKRQMLQKAFTSYLGHAVSLENIAHIIVPIRNGSEESLGSVRGDQPMLEVNVVVHGPSEGCMCHNEDEETSTGERGANGEDQGLARLVLIRMVNHIPLLDGAEAAACGLVRGIAAKTAMWNSFGLSTYYQHPNQCDAAKLLKFHVRDSNQVTPFLVQRNHTLLRQDSDDDSSASVSSKPRRKKAKCNQLLPAHVRLGNIMVIVHIHARPTTLPLPTLSKGRLPAENSAIDNALEVGLTGCLKQLQNTNPSLFLTAAELRKAEREARYVPAVSNALATILQCQQSDNSNIIRRINQWDRNIDKENRRPNCSKIESLIESRFRCILQLQGRKKSKTLLGSKRPKAVRDESDNADDDMNDDLLVTESIGMSVKEVNIPDTEVKTEDRLLVEKMLDDLTSSDCDPAHHGDIGKSRHHDHAETEFNDWL